MIRALPDKARLRRAVLLAAFVIPLLIAGIAALGHNCDHDSPAESGKCDLCVLALSVAVSPPATTLDEPGLSPDSPILYPQSACVLSLPLPSAPRAPPSR